MIGCINITKPFKAEFLKNRQKAQITTKPIEAKIIVCFPFLQNQSYLENLYYKTISFNSFLFRNTIFTKRSVSEIRRTPGLSKLNGGVCFCPTKRFPFDQYR
jgi:hypothetical protein